MTIRNYGKRFLSALLCLCMLFTMSGLEAGAASYSITVSNLTAPETITAGDSFDIKGTIRSTYTIKSAKIGICDSDGKWISGHYTTKKPAKKIYGLSKANDKLHIDTLSKGTYYLKVYVTDSKNHKKTAVKQEFKIKAASAFSIKDLSVPEKLTEGDTFSVKGTVKSEYNIKSIKIGVCDTEGNWLSGHYTTRKPAKKTYSLANAGSSMKFSTLTPGKYCFTVQATDSNKTTETILKNEFTVVKKPSKITVSGYTYPVSLKESSSFTLKGTVKSVYNIKKVRVGIWNNDTGKWYSGMMAEFKPNKTTFDISQADKEIRFSDLTEGTYYYKVYVTDTEGYSKSVIKKKFNVSKIASKFTVSSNISYPSIMTRGSSFSLVGTVNSAVELDSVTIGICDSEGKRISGFNKTVKNIKEKKFYIYTVDEYIPFGKLEPGQYIYRIYAKDLNGTGKTVLNKKFTVMSKFTMDTTTTGSTLSQEMYDAINAEDIFFAQEWGRGGCTVVAAGMMARRKAVMSGVSKSKWSLLTEDSLRADRSIWVYGAGLFRDFSILDMNITQVNFETKATTASKKKKLISMIEQHPEGVAIYSKYGGKAHAVLLTDYTDGVFYVVDPVYGKKVTMAESTLYSKSATQTSRLAALHSYWYIKH